MSHPPGTMSLGVIVSIGDPQPTRPPPIPTAAGVVGSSTLRSKDATIMSPMEGAAMVIFATAILVAGSFAVLVYEFIEGRTPLRAELEARGFDTQAVENAARSTFGAILVAGAVGFGIVVWVAVFGLLVDIVRAL